MAGMVKGSKGMPKSGEKRKRKSKQFNLFALCYSELRAYWMQFFNQKYNNDNYEF